MTVNGKEFYIYQAPSLEEAKALSKVSKIDATVEAEYGDFCVDGGETTLAHHGSRSSNPAPCNTDVAPLSHDKNVILISHIDLDTVGGVMALMGNKPEDKEFWKDAEYIDVNGPHHEHELSQASQDKLNAYNAWIFSQERPERITQYTDVTENIEKITKAIKKILDDRHPEHNQMIENGKIWAKETEQTIENCLIRESENIRVFISDGPFCNAAYYSKNDNQIKPAILTLNKFGTATLSFEDGGKTASAKDIMQTVYGPEAGGRDGIAGSPRGKVISIEAFLEYAKWIETEINEKICLHNLSAGKITLHDVKEEMQTPAVCMTAIIDGKGSLDDIKDAATHNLMQLFMHQGYEKTEEGLNQFLYNVYEDINASPHESLNWVKDNPNWLRYVQQQNEEIVKAAVSNDGLTLKYVQEPTLEICEMAVKQNPDAEQFITDPEMRDAALNDIAIDNDTHEELDDR